MKIIHIDDSKLALMSTAKYLRAEFKECTVISYITEDFQKVMANNEQLGNVDILITDLLMPGISGHEVLKYSKKNYPSVFLVVLSSNTQITEQQMATENGTDYFIEKPIKQEKLERMKEVFYDRRG